MVKEPDYKTCELCIELHSRMGKTPNCEQLDSKGRYVCQRMEYRFTEGSTRIWNTWNVCKDLTALPFPGPLFSQPAKMVKGFMIVSNEIAKYNYEKAKEASQK